MNSIFFKWKKIFWQYLNRYYLTLLIRSYYLVSKPGLGLSLGSSHPYFNGYWATILSPLRWVSKAAMTALSAFSLNCVYTVCFIWAEQLRDTNSIENFLFKKWCPILYLGYNECQRAAFIWDSVYICFEVVSLVKS